MKFSPNIAGHMKLRYKEIFKMEAQDSIGTYLGVNVDINGRKVQHFTPLLDKMSTQISHWKSKGLSQASKLIIINSILVASVVNQLSVFHIPSIIAGKLDGMLARFFWTNAQDKGVHWRRKEILHQLKGLGGLGIRNIAALNTVLLMKQAWRIQQQPQLLLSHIYAQCNFTQLYRSTRRRNVSWGATGVYNASQAMLSTCLWKVGNGLSINASRDKWVRGGTPVMKDNISIRDS